MSWYNRSVTLLTHAHFVSTTHIHNISELFDKTIIFQCSKNYDSPTRVINNKINTRNDQNKQNKTKTKQKITNACLMSHRSRPKAIIKRQWLIVLGQLGHIPYCNVKSKVETLYNLRRHFATQSRTSTLEILCVNAFISLILVWVPKSTQINIHELK